MDFPLTGTLTRLDDTVVDEYGDQEDVYLPVGETTFFLQPDPNRSNPGDSGYEQGYLLHFSDLVEVRRGDRITYDGVTYEIEESQPWMGMDGILNHYRTQATTIVRVIDG